MGRDAEALAQPALRGGGGGAGQIAHVPHHDRPRSARVAVGEPLGDRVADGHERVAARDGEPLDRGGDPGRHARAVEDPRGQLVGVVDEPRPGQPGREQAGEEHR